MISRIGYKKEEMAEFLVLDHTADVGILAEGATLREAFEGAAAGLFHLIADSTGLTSNRTFPVELEGDNLEEILIRWLNHLLYLHEVEKVLLGEFRITELSERRLRATVGGETIDLSRHILKTYVKAATYHDLVVEPGERSKVRVIFDV